MSPRRCRLRLPAVSCLFALPLTRICCDPCLPCRIGWIKWLSFLTYTFSLLMKVSVWGCPGKLCQACTAKGLERRLVGVQVVLGCTAQRLARLPTLPAAHP